MFAADLDRHAVVSDEFTAPSVVVITHDCIKPAMRWPGCRISISTRLKSLGDIGSKRIQNPRLQVHTNLRSVPIVGRKCSQKAFCDCLFKRDVFGTRTDSQVTSMQK